MADGDIIYKQLSRIYQEPYKQLCENILALEDCAWSVMDALLKQIKYKGNDPIILAQQIGEYLAQIFQQGEVNWEIVHKERRNIMTQNKCISYYDKELVLRAEKSIFHGFRYGKIVEANDVPEMMVEQYLKEVYQFNFHLAC